MSPSLLYLLLLTFSNIMAWLYVIWSGHTEFTWVCRWQAKWTHSTPSVCWLWYHSWWPWWPKLESSSRKRIRCGTDKVLSHWEYPHSHFLPTPATILSLIAFNSKFFFRKHGINLSNSSSQAYFDSDLYNYALFYHGSSCPHNSFFTQVPRPLQSSE